MSTDKEILYSASHKAIPNGVGDYDFICPENGFQFFIPYFLRETVGGFCCSCGKDVVIADKDKETE